MKPQYITPDSHQGDTDMRLAIRPKDILFEMDGPL